MISYSKSKMNRSLLIGILSTLALFSSIAIYFYLNNIKIKNRAAIDAVPDDAFIIFQAKDIQSSWLQFSKSTLCNDLKSNIEVNKLYTHIEETFKTINQNNNFKDILSDNNTVISLHNVANSLGLMFTVETGEEIELKNVTDYITKQLKAKSTQRSFEKTTLFDITSTTGNPIFTVAYLDQLLLISKDASLVEEGLRKIKYHIPNQTKGIDQAHLIAEANVDANIFINYQKLPQFANIFTKPEFYNIFSNIKNFANWSVINLDLNEEEFKFSGVTYTDDSLFQFIDLFKNQNPKQLSLQKFMPKNTAMAFQMGFSDYLKFNSELQEYLQVKNKTNYYEKYSDSIESRYNIDITQNIISYIDGEASLVLTEPTSSNYSSNLSAFIRFKNPSAMADALKNIVQAMNKKGETDSVNYYHQGIEIERIKLGNFLKMYYGELMEGIYSPYYAQLEDIFVFANDVTTLKYIIDQYKTGNTLANDEHYKTYEKRLAKNNNISLFISPSKNFLLPTNFVTETFFSTLNTFQVDFKKFEFFNIQFSNTNNKAFYTQVSYKYITTNNNQTQLLWTYKLDTTFDVAPQIVYNSELKQNVIFVQDVKNTLYCIDNAGNLIWRSKLNGKLIGNFKTLDPLQNGSTCYLFVTEKQANLIDVKGVSLYNYPIRFPGNAITNYTLTNLYNDSNNQFFVPLENNRIVAYNLNGKPLQGWMPKTISNKLNHPISTITLGQKRLLYSTDIDGNLCLFDLKGKTIKIDNLHQSNLFQYISNDDTTSISFNVFDTTGLVYILSIDSLQTASELKNTKLLFPFVSVSEQTNALTNNTFYLFKSLNNTTILGSDFKKILAIDETNNNQDLTYFTSSASGKSMVAYFNKTKSEYYWYNMNGELYIDFPIKGWAPFNTCNLMLDRSNYLIGGDQQNNIFAYKLK